MPRFLLSLMFVLLLAPFHFGCGGGDEPLHPATDPDPVEELDPASEADSLKKIK